MARSSDTSLIDDLTHLLADGGRIEGEEMQKVAGDELVAAAADGNLEMISKLIAAGVDINGKGATNGSTLRGLTALMAAVKFRHTEVVSMLLKAGADVNVISELIGTALMIAAAQEHSVFVRMLLEADADVNVTVRSTSPLEALSCAAKAGNIESIRLLLDAGAIIDSGNEEVGIDALFEAASHGHLEAVVLLLVSGSRVDVCSKGGETPLVIAATHSSAEMVQLLVEAGADVNKENDLDGDTPLMAASSSCIEKAKKIHMLLEAGAQFRFEDEFHIALLDIADGGDLDSLRIIESTGVYTHPDFASVWGPPALMRASAEGHVDAVKYLMDKGAEINVELLGVTPLMRAGSQEVLDILLGAGATIPADGRKKAEALRHAARDGKIALVRALINAGVDINAKDPNDLQTPLILAANNNGKEVLPILIEAGANLELRDKEGFTALIRAAERNSFYAVGYLVRAGADVNVAANNTWTPLQYAVVNTNREMIRLLVGAGAEVCPLAEPYIDAMDRYIATVISILPSDYVWELKKKIFDLVLAQHDGVFLKDCPVRAAWARLTDS